MQIQLTVIQNAKGQPRQGVILHKEQVEELIYNEEDPLVPLDEQKPYKIHIFSSTHFQNPFFGMYHLANSCFFRVCDHSFNVFLGGDHYTSFGTIMGSLKQYGSALRVLWIDAHADIHSFETSPSGNMHGMPVRFLLTHHFPDIPQLLPEQILYVGLRSVEKEEWDFIRANDIQYITAAAFLKQTDLAYELIEDFVRDSPLHLSLDVDSLDPSIMRSTGTAESGGLLFPHIQRMLEDSKRVAAPFFGMDIMEYNPLIGTEEEKRVSKETMRQLFQTVAKL